MDYLSTWCDIIGGELLDGIEWDEIADTTGSLAVLRIPPFRIGFRVGTVLTIAINMDANLAAHFYKFNLRLTSGALCWRHDCHAGHESLGAGPYHPASRSRRELPDRGRAINARDHLRARHCRQSAAQLAGRITHGERTEA